MLFEDHSEGNEVADSADERGFAGGSNDLGRGSVQPSYRPANEIKREGQAQCNVALVVLEKLDESALDPLFHAKSVASSRRQNRFARPKLSGVVLVNVSA